VIYGTFIAQLWLVSLTPRVHQQSTVLIVDDDATIRNALARAIASLPAEVICVGDVAAALDVVRTRQIDAIVADYRMPDLTGLDLLAFLEREGISVPFILMTGHATIGTAIEAVRAGVVEFLEKPFDLAVFRQVVAHAVEQSRIVREVRLVHERDGPHGSVDPFIGDAPIIRRLVAQIHRAAHSNSTVLIEGESGTGKELIARAIHDLSSRRLRSFVQVNCAALPEGLVESTFFGHERGAFTGALRRADGVFARAEGGSLLLDEVSEMRLELQAKLLRVLEEREFERVGGSELLRVDVRIIATSNRNLTEAAQSGEFREDLYYRLNVVRLVVPPLRDRPSDIVPLARFFLHQAALEQQRPARDFTPETIELLERSAWPGNVRELKHAVERAVVLADGPVLRPDHFDIDAARESSKTVPAPARAITGPAQDAASAFNLARAERQLIQRALAATGGNRTHAARLLGIHGRTLRKKLNQSGPLPSDA
jgi:DNA-binding NtrC family response regulator